MAEMKVEAAKKPKSPKKVKKAEKALAKKESKKEFKQKVKISKINSGERLIASWAIGLSIIANVCDILIDAKKAKAENKKETAEKKSKEDKTDKDAQKE